MHSLLQKSLTTGELTLVLAEKGYHTYNCANR